MKLLHKTHQQKVILLIDEYDTPIHAGWQYGYYEDVVLFMRNLLSGAMKDNLDLEKSVMTGILRVARDSIFSGLNNLGVYSLVSPQFSNWFGFTEPEVDQMLEDFQQTHRRQEVQDWYNGYLFGNQVIFNPWSVLNFISRQPLEL
ncbi:MAG: AAA family ATPase [SAR324 cluster bacterium]|nr:AAA family ATPase [SAR324 cluster bacterium]